MTNRFPLSGMMAVGIDPLRTSRSVLQRTRVRRFSIFQEVIAAGFCLGKHLLGSVLRSMTARSANILIGANGERFSRVINMA